MRVAHLFAVSALALAGCQDPDVGALCNFDLPGVNDGPVAADFLETGKTECDNLVCIKSPPPPQGSKVRNNPYCSKPCVSNADCSEGETGLVCRKVVLDEAFIDSLPPDVRQRYLGEIRLSTYCAAPVQ
jgi:hypothetical protein